MPDDTNCRRQLVATTKPGPTASACRSPNGGRPRPSVTGPKDTEPLGKLDAVLDLLDSADPEDLEPLLEDMAPQLLTANGLSLRPLLPGLQRLDPDGRPWVLLLLSGALHASDPGDPNGRVQAERALAGFRQSGNTQGEGYALYLLGNEAAVRGELAVATRLWNMGRERLCAKSEAYAHALCNSSLGAYEVGDLRHAIDLAEQGLALSEAGGLPRPAGVASVYLAAYHLWTGDFTRAEAATELARRRFLSLADPAERFGYEWPIGRAIAGVLAALRGERATAERLFTEAFAAADQLDADWVRAIVRVFRAEHSALWAPDRSLADARFARQILDVQQERFWNGVAGIATGVALSHRDNHLAAVHAYERVLVDGRLIPLEAARCSVLLAEALLRTGDRGRAIDLLERSADTLERAGAGYWAARACASLASADTSSSVRHWQRAIGLVGQDKASELLLRGSATLRVHMLGRPRVLVGTEERGFPTRQARAVVFALAAAGRDGLAAETLQSWIWPDVDRAVGARRLKTALWQARRTLGPTAGRLLRRGANVHLKLVPGECDLVDAVEDAGDLLRQPAPPAAALMKVAIQLSRPVMGGEEYADWATDLQSRVDTLRSLLEQAAAQAFGTRHHPPARG